MRTCTRCGELKLDDEFYKTGRAGKRHGACKPCFRRVKTITKFGLTEEQYVEMHDRQDHCCAICGSKEHGGRSAVTSFMIDHCHETNTVRGLLCHSCNIMLGHAKDDSARLRRAADYLDYHNSKLL